MEIVFPFQYPIEEKEDHDVLDFPDPEPWMSKSEQLDFLPKSFARYCEDRPMREDKRKDGS
jgi:hypothetical protein